MVENTVRPIDPIIIPTYNSEEEVWHYVTKLTSISYVEDLLKKRVDHCFFFDFSAIDKAKDEHGHSERYKILSSDFGRIKDNRPIA